METSSSCVGLMAVVAVSGSVALVTLQLQKRLSSDLIEKLESQLRSNRARIDGPTEKKKVRFAPDVIDPSTNNEDYRRRRSLRASNFRLVAVNRGRH